MKAASTSHKSPKALTSRAAGSRTTGVRGGAKLPVALADSVLVLSPGLLEAPVLDRMCSHFVLSLTMKQAARFNLKRDWNSLLGLTGRHLAWPASVLGRFRAFLTRRCKGNTHWKGHDALSDHEFIQKHGIWRGPYEEGTVFFYVDEYVKDAPKDILAVLGATAEWLEKSLKKESTLVQKNIDSLAGLLQLNPAERALLLYGTLARYQRDLRGLLVEFKVQSAQEAYAAIAAVAGVKEQEVAEALRAGSRLERTGMVENLISEHNITDLADLMKVSDQLPPVLMREYKKPADLMAVFTRPAVKSELTPTDFAYVGEDVHVLTTLLKNAVERKEAGVNVLLYGPPGTGKTELAKVCAQTAGLNLFEVEYADRDGNSLSGRDRYRSLQISQVFLKASRQVGLLFDEVEDVFPPISPDAAQLMARMDTTDATPSGSVSGKAWVNQILETNPVPVVWVTNRIEQIDPAFRRRFQYHLELKSPPPGAREALVTRALQGVPTDEGFAQKLSQRKGLTPAQIRTAVRFAKLAGDVGGEQGGEGAPYGVQALIERQLGNADKALGRSASNKPARRVVTTYDLDMLHVESKFEIPKIVEALGRRGHGTLCFHGSPGTGKTALGEHIASALQKPLMIRQASDLVSKFVGETEQNMAKMFEEAQAENAVLLLDEADSFLRSRKRAERSYEVTEVNEMLQGMERFGGIFICTTNLFEDLDEAALRRFTFKIKFKPLLTEQRERMFVTEALAGDAAQLNPEHRERLAKLECLVPGDFAAVKRQVDLLDQTFSADEFLSQLESEHRVKPDVRERRGIGFSASVKSLA